MRKSWLFIIALVTLGFLADAAVAATVQINGRHGMGEIASTYASVGGTFSSGLGGDYQCSNSCGDGQLAQFFATRRAIAKVRAPAAVNADNAAEDLCRC
jgi:hypothetical protein